jgi:hypothetical protein
MVSDNTYSPCRTGYESTRLRGNNDDGSTPSDWGGPANLDAYCKHNNTSDLRGSRFAPRPDNADVTNSDPYPGPVYGKDHRPTVAQQESHPWPGRGSSPGGSTKAAAASVRSGDRETVVPLPYDPTTGLLTGLDGKSYQLGFNGPLDPIFGSSSWEWLLLAPTMR